MSMSFASSILDRGWIPDPLIRFGIRRLLNQRLKSEWSRNDSDPRARHQTWKSKLVLESIASEPEIAKDQHYEVPTRFFELVLGPRLKYSSCFWDPSVRSLADAEERMLELTVHRAEIGEGQRILDLGCGWGSLSLWMAERFPTSTVIAVSNSETQANFIRWRAEKLNLRNLEHVIANVETLELEGEFDRVVSVEMFEHMRNYEALLEKIAGWLSPKGRLFVHMFCHKELTYPFEDRGRSDWMARHFFRGGLMPAAGLLPQFEDHLRVEKSWMVNGSHYQHTAEAWLKNLERAKSEIKTIFANTYGANQASMWVSRWRIFFMACAELFGAESGEEWQVAHYRLKPSREL